MLLNFVLMCIFNTMDGLEMICDVHHTSNYTNCVCEISRFPGAFQAFVVPIYSAMNGIWIACDYLSACKHYFVVDSSCSNNMLRIISSVLISRSSKPRGSREHMFCHILVRLDRNTHCACLLLPATPGGNA